MVVSGVNARLGGADLAVILLHLAESRGVELGTSLEVGASHGHESLDASVSEETQTQAPDNGEDGLGQAD